MEDKISTVPYQGTKANLKFILYLLSQMLMYCSCWCDEDLIFSFLFARLPVGCMLSSAFIKKKYILILFPFFQGNIWAASGAGPPEPGPRFALQTLGTYSQGKRHPAIFNISNIVCRSGGSGSGISGAGCGKRIPTIPSFFRIKIYIRIYYEYFRNPAWWDLKKVGFYHCFALVPKCEQY